MQNDKLEKEDAIQTGDALENFFFFKKKASIGIFFRAQIINYGAYLLLPCGAYLLLNCSHIQSNGTQKKFRLCSILDQVHKMF